MEKWEVKESGYCLKDGFAFVVFVDADNVEFGVQACLREREECADERHRWQMVQTGRDLYKKEINSNDTGADWGLSGDANKKGFAKHGQEECMKQFKREIKKIGIRFK
jgi:hypothetical protein